MFCKYCGRRMDIKSKTENEITYRCPSCFAEYVDELQTEKTETSNLNDWLNAIPGSLLVELQTYLLDHEWHIADELNDYADLHGWFIAIHGREPEGV